MTRTTKLAAVLAANLALVAALAGVGIGAHSLALFAEGADYLADAAGIGVALLAIHLAQRPPTPKHVDGWPRATRHAAAINAGWLLLLSLLVAVGAAQHLVVGAGHVRGLPVLITSATAAAIMLAGALLLGGDLDDDDRDEGHDQLNIRAVLLDTAADAAAAAGVALSGAVITITGRLDWLDPAIALVIAIVVGYHAARLLIHVRGTLRR